MMSDPTTVDRTTVDQSTGKIVLVIEEDRPWEEPGAMHRELQSKVKRYVRHIRSDEFTSEHGKSPEDTVIRLVCSDPPGDDTVEFLARVRYELSKLGIDFEHRVEWFHDAPDDRPLSVEGWALRTEFGRGRERPDEEATSRDRPASKAPGPRSHPDRSGPQAGSAGPHRAEKPSAPEGAPPAESGAKPAAPPKAEAPPKPERSPKAGVPPEAEAPLEAEAPFEPEREPEVLPAPHAELPDSPESPDEPTAARSDGLQPVEPRRAVEKGSDVDGPAGRIATPEDLAELEGLDVGDLADVEESRADPFEGFDDSFGAPIELDSGEPDLPDVDADTELDLGEPSDDPDSIELEDESSTEDAFDAPADTFDEGEFGASHEFDEPERDDRRQIAWPEEEFGGIAASATPGETPDSGARPDPADDELWSELASTAADLEGIDPVAPEEPDQAPDPSLIRGLGSALGTAIVFSIAWGLLAVAAGHPASPVALALGLSVGFSVRLRGAGSSFPFRFIGGLGTSLGCVLGSLLAVAGLLMLTQGVSLLTLWGRFAGFETALHTLSEFYGFTDLGVYAIAIILSSWIAASRKT